MKFQICSQGVRPAIRRSARARRRVARAPVYFVVETTGVSSVRGAAGLAPVVPFDG